MRTVFCEKFQAQANSWYSWHISFGKILTHILTNWNFQRTSTFIDTIIIASVLVPYQGNLEIGIWAHYKKELTDLFHMFQCILFLDLAFWKIYRTVYSKIIPISNLTGNWKDIHVTHEKHFRYGNVYLEASKIIGQRKAFYRQRIP